MLLLLTGAVLLEPGYRALTTGVAPEVQGTVVVQVVSGLPVEEGGRLVGILTITDLLRAFVGFLGLREGGTRVTVDAPDAPGVLARMAQAGPPSNIVAAVTSEIEPGRTRRLVLRVVGEDAEGFPEPLRAAGLDVVDVR